MFRKILCVFVIFYLILTSGCGESKSKTKNLESSNTSKYGGVYSKAFSDGFITLDPAKIKDSDSHEIARQIFDGLVELDCKANVVPSIATKWTISRDKLKYTFILNHNCHFHKFVGQKLTKNGGRKLTASDVSYTFYRLFSKPNDYQSSFFYVIKGSKEYSEGKTKNISGIKILASDTIQFELTKPFSPFLSLLATCNAFIVPREDIEPNGFSRKYPPVGTGPFQWKSTDGKNITLVANKNYFRGRPFLDKIKFLIVPNAEKRFAMFKKGEIMQVEIPDSVYEKVKNDPKYKSQLIETSIWSVNYLGFNLQKKPFDNIKVRKAFNYAIDKKAIVNLVMNNRVKIARGILPPGMLGYADKPPKYTYNLAKAKELLAEAGYPNGKGFPEITLTFNKNEIHERVAEFVVANLKDIGIQCKTDELSFNRYLKRVEDGASFFRMGWSVDYPDPDNFLYTLFHSSNIQNGHNYCRFKDALVDEILTEARYTTSFDKRVGLYRSAEDLLIDKAPWVFLYFYKASMLRQSNVHGIQLGHMGSAFLQYRKIYLSH